MIKLLKNLWHGLDIGRKIFLNLVFFIFLIWFIAAISSSGDKPTVEKGVALVLRPTGNIVEQLTWVDPIEKAIQDATDSSEPPEELLYDLIEAVRQAKEDKRITALVISTRYMGGAGVTKLQDLAKAIEDFKSSGKKVIAFDDNFSQGQYYLASLADEVYMSPEGGIFLTGFARVGTYFKGLLDNLDVNVHVFKVGKFKSAVEPFIRNDMSPEAKEANQAWLGDLWRDFTQDIAARRGITADDIAAYIDNYKENLIAAQGNSAKLAEDAKLIDGLKNRIEFNEYMKELFGEDKNSKSFKQISHKSYLKAIRNPLADMIVGDSPRVAVITAKGSIVDGEHKEGEIGGDTVAKKIRKARTNKNTKAIVLRVDSGGGSAFASEIIREQLEKAQQQGIKVVTSMGDVAASGGYWISATSDEIWARESTITGSIGIFGMIPTFEKPMNKYGIFRDGVGTTKYANPVDTGRPLSEDVAQIVQTSIDAGYDKFLALVARGRHMTKEDVDKIAQGRVWSGKQALSLGLVDKIGNIDDAIQSAAKLAGLDEGQYKVWHVKRTLTEHEKLMQEIFQNARAQEMLAGTTKRPADNLVSSLKNQFAGVFQQLSIWQDPNNTYANCMCQISL